MQEAVKRVRVDESLVTYALEIVKRTRESEFLSLGVSPRGAQALYRAAQAMAFLDGRNFCTPEDFKPLAVPVFAHRVVVNGGYASTLKKSEQVRSGAERDCRERCGAGVRPVAQYRVLAISSSRFHWVLRYSQLGYFCLRGL